MVTRVRNGGAGEPVAACALLLGLLIVGAGESRAQSELGTKPLIVYLDEERQRYLKFGTYVQVWARYTDMNPGSVTSDGGLVQDSATDISIRRFRASMDAQFTEHAMGYIQLGLNNLNFQSERRTSVDLLDAYAEYKFSKAFAIGGGKSAWNGLSRYSAPSPSRSLTLDIPLVALPTLNITDDLLRNLGVWFKGQVSRLDYRAIAFKPFSVDDAEPREDMAEFIDDGLGNAGAVSAYLKWQFFEHESNRLPFSPGTYLARKKVLAVGAGYEFQGDRTAHLEQGETVFNDLKLWAVDVFVDLPLNRQRRTAVTAYAAVFDYDFGPNSIRNIGVNNPASGVVPELASLNGAGNAFPLVGTGRSYYVQAGYLFPPIGRDRALGQLQPFFDYQSSDFERLDERMTAWYVGLNWLLRGHNSRFSFAVQSRPIYYEQDDRIVVQERKTMVVLQYQFRLE